MRCNEMIGCERAMGFIAAFLAALLVIPQWARAQGPTKETEQAFVRYITAKEMAMNRELADGGRFLWVDALPRPLREQGYANLMNGKILIYPAQQKDSAGSIPVPGGLIHDWTGVVLIPGVSISQVTSLLQDYDHSSEFYRPQVMKSKLLERSGNNFHVFLRLKQTHIITVVIDTEYDVRYTFLDPTHSLSRSYSTRVTEIENAGEPGERALPPTNDHGFLWRLFSYWRFYQSEDGVYVQCNAVSLTRNVPVVLDWLVRPFLETIPKDSLLFTLESTRTSVIKQTHGSNPQTFLSKENR